MIDVCGCGCVCCCSELCAELCATVSNIYCQIALHIHEHDVVQSKVNVEQIYSETQKWIDQGFSNQINFNIYFQE